MTQRSGGRILVDQLLIQGTERLACVPGESYLAVLDALHDAKIDVLVCRNEGGAAMMAEAYGKLTGKPGICFVTRGPGATNASHGVHIAAQDSTPMILFIGQVERQMREREAFQEVDYKAFFGSMAKWVVEAQSAARLPELVARAYRVACQGRPGPVVIALPEDVLTETADVPDAPAVTLAEAWPRPEDVSRFGELLRQAKKPLFILGGSRWTEAAQKSLIAFSERFHAPVATSFRRAHLFPSDHPNYVGDVGIGPNPKLAARVKDADLLVLVGARMSEMASSAYSLIDIPRPRQTLVHVYPGAEELGRVYQPALAIQATGNAFCTVLADLAEPNEIPWAKTTVEARREFLDWTDKPAKIPGKFQYGDVMRWLSDTLPPEAIITNGAGNYSIWLHRYYRYRRLGAQLAPISGSMGYGVPAAVMAKRQFPDRPVIAFAGDGCFMMNGQEFATAVQYDIPLIVIIVDNAMYGTIRMHQEREYPNRVSATLLRNPDFAAYAKAFGGHGERIETTDEFAPAFERAVKSGRPAILHCLIDPEALTPSRTLSQIRDEAIRSGR